MSGTEDRRRMLVAARITRLLGDIGVDHLIVQADPVTGRWRIEFDLTGRPTDSREGATS